MQVKFTQERTRRRRPNTPVDVDGGVKVDFSWAFGPHASAWKEPFSLAFLFGRGHIKKECQGGREKEEEKKHIGDEFG